MNEKPFEVTDEFYIAIGRATIAWATVEIPLDAIVGILFMKAGSDKYAAEVPRSLSNKIEFCRKCFKNLSVVADARETALPLLTQITNLSKSRHDLIHGIVDNFTPVRDGEIIIYRLVYEKTSARTERRKTSLGEIAAVIDQSVLLASQSCALLEHLRKKFGIEIENPL